MTDATPPPTPDVNVRIEPLLAHALATAEVDEQALARMKGVVEAEWRAAVAGGSRPRRAARHLAPAAMAAALVAAVGIGWWVAREAPPAAAFGSMARSDDGAVAVQSGVFGQRNLRPGDVLRVGDQLHTRGPILVSLARGGTLRIAAGTALRIAAPEQLALNHGLIYLDLPSGPGSGSPLRVVTNAGAVEHVGTEFEVMSDDRAVRVRVREGRIRFLGTQESVFADAGTELLVSAGKTVASRPIDTFGRDWLWTAALAPDYEIEGRPLMGFLQWVSRELGRPLDFADARAREIADRTTLHGSVRRQAPMDAIAFVLATTSLHYELSDGKILVHSDAATTL